MSILVVAITKLFKKNQLFRSTKIATDISIDYRPTLDRNIERLSLTINQVSTDHRPSLDQLLTDTSVKNRPTISEVSAKSRRSVGEVSVYEKLYRLRYIWNDCRPTINRVSTECRPTIDRYIDRVSTDYRPLYQPIDRSTFPSVNIRQTEIWVRD